MSKERKKNKVLEVEIKWDGGGKKRNEGKTKKNRNF